MNKTAQHIEENDFSTFLEEAGWPACEVQSLSADMGARRYFRLSQDGKTALLMDMSRSGYESGLKAYVDVATYLAGAGARVPEIYYYDLDLGYAVIEDLGAKSFGDAMRQGEPKENIYARATDALIDMKQGAGENTLSLKGYQDTLIYDRLSQFAEYYMPIATGKEASTADDDALRAVLAEIETSLAPCPMGFCHADFHLENLMWAEDGDAPYALIDFQDAFWGFQGYDLLNLLEDARASVPDDIKTKMKDRYCAGMSDATRENFDNWYVLLSSHFHLRVIGLFIKFSQDNGTTDFLGHIPRLQNYIKMELQHPMMAPLKKWLEDRGVSFDIALDDLLKKAHK